MAPVYDLAQLLPHRPPFRLIDRVLDADLTAGTLTAARLITADDPLYPQPEPALPGTLVIEALCQAAACLNGLLLRAAVETRSTEPPHRGYLVALTDFRFHDVVQTGETLVLKVMREGSLGAMQAFAATASAISMNGPTGQNPRNIAGGRLLFALAAS